MDQSSNLSEEIKPWERFEYALREENMLLFKKMLDECGENEDYMRLLAPKMNTFLPNHYLWS